MRLVERPSIELREWMRKDIVVELWETRPRIVEKKQEDDSVMKEVVLDTDSRPIIDKRSRGVLRINLS